MAQLKNSTVDGTVVIDGTLQYYVATNSQTGAYTLQLTDFAKVIEFNNTSAANVTIPPNASVAFPIGTIVRICRIGSGSLSLVAGAGVTLSRTGGFGTNEEIYIRKRATNSWIVVDSPTNLAGTGSVSPGSANGFTQFVYTSTGSSNTFSVA